jgi:hypothetical protein
MITLAAEHDHRFSPAFDLNAWMMQALHGSKRIAAADV